MEEEYFFTCPHCWQQISVLLDLTAGAQAYVEDCEVCCRPIALSYDTDGETVESFAAEPVEE